MTGTVVTKHVTKKWMRYRSALLRGDWQSHSTFTDGRSTVDDMCAAAVANGLELLAITEHVRKVLSYDFGAFVGAVEKARGRYPQLTVLAGCEAKVVNLQGDLDVADEVRDRSDLVVGVFHSFPVPGKDAYLEALHNMLRRADVDMWGHPTLYAVKRGIALTADDARAIGAICNEHQVLVERNSKHRVPSADFIRDSGIEHWVCGSDAHHASELLSLDRIQCSMS